MSTTTLDRPTGVDPNCAGTRHGTLAAYVRSRCRCPETRTMVTDHRRKRRQDLVAAGRAPYKPRPATGHASPRPPGPDEVWSPSSRDRLRVLIAVGHTVSELAARLPGVPVAALVTKRNRHCIPRQAAAQVQAVFADLVRYSEAMAPCGADADEALAYAVAKRWGVVDVVAVRRALLESTHADPAMRRQVPLTSLERRAVIYFGAALGYSITAICRAAHVSDLTVSEALDRGRAPKPAVL